MKKSLFSRADLLRVLHSERSEAVNYAADSLGYELEVKKNKIQQIELQFLEPPRDTLIMLPVVDDFSPTNFWRVVGCHYHTPEESSPNESEREADWPVWELTAEPPEQELASWSNIEPRLHRELTMMAHVGRLDVDKTVKRLCRAEIMRHFPRKSRRCWGDSVQLILDRSTAMTPFWQDQINVCIALESIYPEGGISYASYRRGGVLRNEDGEGRRYQLPEAGSLVMVLGDLGMLSSEQEQAHWQRLGQQLKQKQCRAVALVPGQLAQSVTTLKKLWRILPWEHASAAEVDQHQLAQQVNHLLVLLSPAASRIDRGFLRQLRRMIAADAAAEALLWDHPAICGKSSMGAVMEPAKAAEYRTQFDQLDKDLRLDVLTLLRQWRTHLHAVIWYEEVLTLPSSSQALVPCQDRENALRYIQLLGKSASAGKGQGGMHYWLRSLEQRCPKELWNQPDIKAALQCLWYSTHAGEVDAVPPMEDYDPALNPVDKDRPEQIFQVYQHNSNLVLQIGKQPLESSQGSLVGQIYSRNREFVVLKPRYAQLGLLTSRQKAHLEHLQILVSPAIRIERGFLRDIRKMIKADVKVEISFWNSSSLINYSDSGCEINDEQSKKFRIMFEDEIPNIQRAVLKSLRYWHMHSTDAIYYEEVLRLSQVSQGFIADSNSINDALKFFNQLSQKNMEPNYSKTGSVITDWFREVNQRLMVNEPKIQEDNSNLAAIWADVHRAKSKMNFEIDFEQLNMLMESPMSSGFDFWKSGAPPEWADDWGDDEFGGWVEFSVKGERGRIQQRMRWMPSGSFLMGSADNEEGRNDDEGPQHRVILDDGYWMFDTVVKQALWLAVMGETPSVLKGEDLPVENVSWHDCERFIKRINGMLPGLGLSLPSEAQWEYGCRAGSETAYSFGEEVSHELASYEGKAGETVPVKSYAANDWGLWQMHGNIDEWVKDCWHSNYEGAPIDGSAWVSSGSSRGHVVRGGCWIYYPRDLRSASRIHADSGSYSNKYLGFRCVRVQVTGLARAEPIEPEQQRSGTRSAGPDRSGGAVVKPESRMQESTSLSPRIIIEDGSGQLRLPDTGSFELRSDRGAVQIHQLTQPEWASAMGRDPYGLWAEFVLEYQDDVISQRLRWIPPGQFLMGSPESEVDRENDEEQHLVVISKGYWLFDTPVRQALWKAVMKGKNPSHFKGDALPVEEVSWKACGEFIRRINERLPKMKLTLPSEAQWEYACRAGTETVFNFGDEIAPELANYGENYLYPSDDKEEPRDTSTVPVENFKRNDWGLWQMHGNVGEWCLDGLRDYEEGSGIDPLGAQEDGVGRAVRGGSWGDNPRSLRSAYRDCFDPGYRNQDLGFRPARVQEQDTK